MSFSVFLRRSPGSTKKTPIVSYKHPAFTQSIPFMHPLGFVRLSATSIELAVADPSANADAILRCCEQLRDSDVIVFPELSLCGYTCGELFLQDRLLDACMENLVRLVKASSDCSQLWVVGLPLRFETRLFNVAAIIHHGRLLGCVPKQFLPTYQEFYERRWFSSGKGLERREVVVPHIGEVPFGTDLLFECGNVMVGVEICEDLWMPIPPSSIQALAGANVLLNLSASNETIGKSAYRRELVTSQSGRCLAAYAYSSAGPTESTTDLVFGGHCMVAENGTLLKEATCLGVESRKGDALRHVTVDIDLSRLLHDRRMTGTFSEGSDGVVSKSFRSVPFALTSQSTGLNRLIPGQPFVPQNPAQLEERCREIFGIQCAALAKRVHQLPKHLPLVIGVSGGLDSTLSLLVAVAMCDHESIPRSRIHGLTMPGFGTSKGTLENSRSLMRELHITAFETDIRETCLQIFRDLNHSPFGMEIGKKTASEFQSAIESLHPKEHSDLVFENVQARTRTLLLMSRGFVLGTGDLSEQALGWSTYNGDHMSMYNVNCSIPKTLVQFLVRYVAAHHFEGELRRILMAIANTPISPELLPLSSRGEIQQATEDTIGPYELHDFFLYHFVRTGASPEKILFLAEHAQFSQSYDRAVMKRALKLFLQRFFANQFKRSCVPDGPKVGSVSLSPRGDWRMPSDASVQAWLKD
jgi:NAD+ synthase (glutamine-hydrolysing)